MTKFQKAALFALRISLGGLFLYAGVSKLMDPSWSAAGYLKGARALEGLYGWLARPDVLPITNFLNEWGLTLIGVALILGVSVRLAAVVGVGMMTLYYLPLGFPHPNEHAFIIDEHIVYIAGFLVLAAFNAGRVWGLGNSIFRAPVVSRSSTLRFLLK